MTVKILDNFTGGAGNLTSHTPDSGASWTASGGNYVLTGAGLIVAPSGAIAINAAGGAAGDPVYVRVSINAGSGSYTAVNFRSNGTTKYQLIFFPTSSVGASGVWKTTSAGLVDLAFSNPVVAFGLWDFMVIPSGSLGGATTFAVYYKAATSSLWLYSGSVTDTDSSITGTNVELEQEGAASTATAGVAFDSFREGTAGATTTALAGATSGSVGSPSVFSFGIDEISGSAVVITPVMTGLAGSWSPSTVTVPAGSLVASATSSFTPSASGTGTPTTTNGSSLTNGTAATYASSSTAATALTLTGPTSGSVGVQSGNYTVGANGVISGTVVVTPNAGSGGGTFAPTTVSLTSGSPTATFKYTPASSGTKVIGITNGSGLTNPASINDVVTAASPPVAPALPPTLTKFTQTSVSGICSAFTAGASGSLTYQWYKSSKNGDTVGNTTCVAISGQTSLTLTATGLVQPTNDSKVWFFFVLCTDGNGNTARSYDMPSPLADYPALLFGAIGTSIVFLQGTTSDICPIAVCSRMVARANSAVRFTSWYNGGVGATSAYNWRPDTPLTGAGSFPDPRDGSKNLYNYFVSVEMAAAEAAAGRQTDIFVIMHETNDWGQGRTPTQYATDMKACIDALHALRPSAKFFLSYAPFNHSLESSLFGPDTSGADFSNTLAAFHTATDQLGVDYAASNPGMVFVIAKQMTRITSAQFDWRDVTDVPVPANWIHYNALGIEAIGTMWAQDIIGKYLFPSGSGDGTSSGGINGSDVLGFPNY